jgi:hypothetical protein
VSVSRHEDEMRKVTWNGPSDSLEESEISEVNNRKVLFLSLTECKSGTAPKIATFAVDSTIELRNVTHASDNNGI